MFIVLLVVAVLFVATRIAIPYFGKSAAAGIVTVKGEAQLADCPDTPNCVSSTATDPSKRVEPIDFSKPAGDVIPALARWLGQQERVTVVTSSDDYLHATFRTALMGYTDDVEFMRQPDGALQVRSASRLGKSDLGANRKRVESMRTSLAGEI